MTTPAEIRAQAARIVVQVNAHGKSLDALLAGDVGTAQERGLLRSLVYGTIRWQLRLEVALDRLSTRPQSALEPAVRGLLLVGLYQLLHTDIAVHAAVAETVEATRVLREPRAANFVNAILRRCLRELERLKASLDEDIAVRTAHSAWLIDTLRHDHPERFVEILDANNAHPPMWLRVNTRKTTVAAYQQKLSQAGFGAERNCYAPEALLLATPTDVHTLPGFDSGEVSVQDAAAQLAAHLLAPQPQDRVLDVCAAPGGKTCHLLELQPDAGEVIAVDSAAERLTKVRENLDRLQLSATVVQGDALDPKDWWDGRPFERILLDVPCSATGVIRRHPDIKLLRRPGDIPALVERQARMLRAMWPLVAKNGRLLYASCSALRAETVDVVASFLAETHDAIDFSLEAGKTMGLTVSPGPGLVLCAGEAQMDGFYYACLGKR